MYKSQITESELTTMLERLPPALVAKLLASRSVVPDDAQGQKLLSLNGKQVVNGTLEEFTQRDAPVATVRQTFRRYQHEYLSGVKSRDAITRIIGKTLLAAHGSKPITQLTKADVRAVLQVYKDRGQKASYNITYGCIAAFLGWCLSEDVVPLNVAAGIKRYSIPPRNTVLTDDQLRKIWKAAGEVKYGELIKLLMLTGARPGEIATARWSDFDPGECTLSVGPERSKTKTRNIIPLVPEAMRIIAKLKRRTPHSYIISHRGNKPFAMNGELKRHMDEKLGFKNWIVYNIRHTTRTNLSKLGVLPDTAERVLNHALPGIRSVYDHYSYLPERRAALEKLEQHYIAQGIIPRS